VIVARKGTFPLFPFLFPRRTFWTAKAALLSCRRMWVELCLHAAVIRWTGYAESGPRPDTVQTQWDPLRPVCVLDLCFLFPLFFACLPTLFCRLTGPPSKAYFANNWAVMAQLR
jgi:hypothetical protein